jgi:hypothetical protein
LPDGASEKFVATGLEGCKRSESAHEIGFLAQAISANF